jgi:rare lipoprotein A (peptidoglycan hydrolase)
MTSHPHRWWLGGEGGNIYSYRKERQVNFLTSLGWITFWACIVTILVGCFFLLSERRAEAGEIGTASYYTYESCRREGTSGVWTASGARFDENALTCAMWDIPFGTILRVTNTENGKSVLVKVNDRGPSRRLVKQGRIVDLSKGAFEAIADLHKGVIRVNVERLERGA